MSAAAIYRKTPAGEREFLAMSRDLEPRLRSLLLLVDGRRTRLDLARAFPELALSDEPLERLAAQGLIERVPDGSVGARVVSLGDYRARRGLPPAVPRGPAPAQPIAVELPLPVDAGLAAEREALVRFVRDELGLDGDGVERRLRRCGSRIELDGLVDTIGRMLARIAEPRLAKLFAERFGSLARRCLPSGLGER